MNKEQYKRKLINDISLNLMVNSEVLKSQDLINNYNVSVEIKNEKISEDGVREYDVHITQLLYPKVCLQNITLDFNVLPTGFSFEDIK